MDELSTCTYMCYLLYSHNTHLSYIGVTNNIMRRLRQHNGEISGGAKFTRRAKDWRVVAISKFQTLSDALRFEKQAKKIKTIKKRSNLFSEDWSIVGDG